MIHLDTNYLIRLPIAKSHEAVLVGRWLVLDGPLAVSAMVWTGFLNGSVTSDQAELAASNGPDFKHLVPLGLNLGKK